MIAGGGERLRASRAGAETKLGGRLYGDIQRRMMAMTSDVYFIAAPGARTFPFEPPSPGIYDLMTDDRVQLSIPNRE